MGGIWKKHKKSAKGKYTRGDGGGDKEAGRNRPHLPKKEKKSRENKRRQRGAASNMRVVQHDQKTWSNPRAKTANVKGGLGCGLREEGWEHESNRVGFVVGPLRRDYLKKLGWEDPAGTERKENGEETSACTIRRHLKGGGGFEGRKRRGLRRVTA